MGKQLTTSDVTVIREQLVGKQLTLNEWTVARKQLCEQTADLERMDSGQETAV